MKWSSLFVLCLVPKLVFSVGADDSLTHYETLYDAIEPAIEKSHEAFVCYTDIPDPFFNVVMHLSCENVREKVETILEKTPGGKPISFWVHQQNHAPGLVEILQEKGFGPLITCPLFSWKVKTAAAPKVDIRKADRKVFHEIVATVYGLNGAVKMEFEKLMEKLDCENYVIYEDGIAVGAATLFVKGTIAGIFNDASLPGKRQAPEAMTKFLMHRSSELGLENLVLLSSPEGESLYTDLGFEKAFEIDIYSKQ